MEVLLKDRQKWVSQEYGFLRSREERMEIQTAPRINERSVSLSYWWRKESRK
jgi:hypothetical protein